MSRVVLVSGCSSPAGIGMAAALALAARGHTVYATVRDPERAPPRLAAAAGVEVVGLELLDDVSRRDAVRRVLDRSGRLDVLVNNAGFGLIGGIEQTRIEQARANMETNFLATMALVQQVLPAMRAQRCGQIVNVSTVFASALCPPAIGWYVATKAALQAACEALALELAGDGITVTNFQPGPVATELSRDYGDRLPQAEDPRPTLVDELYAWVGRRAPAMQSADQIAAALADVITRPPAGLAAQSGPAARRHVDAALRDPSRAMELASLLGALEPD